MQTVSFFCYVFSSFFPPFWKLEYLEKEYGFVPAQSVSSKLENQFPLSVDLRHTDLMSYNNHGGLLASSPLLYEMTSSVSLVALIKVFFMLGEKKKNHNLICL